MRPASEPYDSILETIGATPTVRLSRILEPGAAAVHLKLEQFNPTGSMKDRVALAMIERAEAEGRLKPGGTVVEATSGNMGIALALVCAMKGYRLVLTLPESMSLERRALLRTYGVRLELTPAERHMEGALARARELAAEIPGAYMPAQFENPVNPGVYAATAAEEILEAARADGEAVAAFVAGIGTGGALTGIGRTLKARAPGVRIVAVAPEGSDVLGDGGSAPHRIQGIGVGFVPPVLDRAVIDRVVTVPDRAAWAMKERLAREEGILAGISTGANVHAALKVARELGPGRSVHTLCCDTGERYFSLAGYFR